MADCLSQSCGWGRGIMEFSTGAFVTPGSLYSLQSSLLYSYMMHFY